MASIKPFGEKTPTNNNIKRYVPLCDSPVLSTIHNDKTESIIPSKVMVIENLNVTIVKRLKDREVSFVVDTKFGILSDNKTVPEVDIMVNAENESFDEEMTLNKLKYIIRRCGILEKYQGYFSNDPEIIINSYTLNIRKDYEFFDEFLEGILIASDIFANDMSAE